MNARIGRAGNQDGPQAGRRQLARFKWYGWASASVYFAGGRSERCGQRRSMASVGGKVKSWRNSLIQLCVAVSVATLRECSVPSHWLDTPQPFADSWLRRSYVSRKAYLVSGRSLRVRAKSVFNTVDMGEFGDGPTDDDKIIAELHPVRAPSAIELSWSSDCRQYRCCESPPAPLFRCSSIFMS